VLPEYQHRGVASLLLRDGIELADKENPPPPMYLEATSEARIIYEHLGYRGVKGEGEGFAMIRNPPDSVETHAEKTD
jgi:GNAT superfamily N-acetyltransferase